MVYFKFGKGSESNERTSGSGFSQAKLGDFSIERLHKAAYIHVYGPRVIGFATDKWIYKKDVKDDHEKSLVARKLKSAAFARIEFRKK